MAEPTKEVDSIMEEIVRKTVAELSTGDLVSRSHHDPDAGADVTRRILVRDAEEVQLPYRGTYHPAVRVTGLDLERVEPVWWIAVPDQRITVRRVS